MRHVSMTTRPLRSLFASSAATIALLAGGVASAATLPVTFYLPLRNAPAAEAAAQALQTPGGAQFHKFLTLKQFLSSYAPTARQYAAAELALTQEGYTVTTTYANRLAIEATATAAAVQSTLGVRMVERTAGGVAGYAPDRLPTLPARLQGMFTGVVGLDTLHHAHPHLVHVIGRSAAGPAAKALLPTGPGNYLPADFERFYDVNPLYTNGATGAGRTIGIVTLADYDVSDDFNFWSQLGLLVSPTRVTKISVDGGVGVVKQSLGEGETDIDTEESGAIAPAANLRVYVSSNNTNANFINGFEAAASDNIADTVSTSWGETELDYLSDGASADATLQAFHAVFLEMALQGQTLFASSGDSGAYDSVDECGVTGTPSTKTPVCNAPYSVDHPASDPLVTAAGGTTLPFSAPNVLPNGVTVTFSVPAERAWGWDYIAQEAAAQGQASEVPVSAVFSTGDGGGVSSYWARPWYQAGVAGITTTKPGQTYTQNTGSGPVLLVTLPSGFAGRNLPDVSTNADPYSGYQYISAGKVQNNYGGTSFVAPQLNGVTALFDQLLGARVGQVSPAAYMIGGNAFNDIAAGNNWGYDAVAGYDNAVGVGTLDADLLYTTIEGLGLF